MNFSNSFLFLTCKNNKYLNMKRLVDYILESKKENSTDESKIGGLGNKPSETFLPRLNRDLTEILISAKLVKKYIVTDKERENLKGITVDVYLNNKIIYSFDLSTPHREWQEDLLKELHSNPKGKELYSYNVIWDTEGKDIVGTIRVMLKADKKAKEKDIEDENRIRKIRDEEISASYERGDYQGD